MTIENKTDNKYLDALIKDAFDGMPYDDPYIIVKDYDLDRVYLDVDGENLISERGIFQILNTTKIEIDYTLFKISSRWIL